MKCIIPIIIIVLLPSTIFAKRKETLVDQVHSTLSKDIVNLATRIDNFFGTKRSDFESNNTRIRIYTISTKYEGENASSQGKIKLQLVLPKTQKRLQLVLENDNDNNGNGASTNQAATANNNNTTATSTSQKAADATTAALRYIVHTAGIRTSFDAGLRFTNKPQVFYHLRLRRDIPFGKWVFRPVEQIKWIQDQGYSSNTDLNFSKKLNTKWIYRFFNNIYWNDQDYTIYFTNGPSWFQKINEKIGLSYNLRAKSSNSPILAANDYSASIGYRQLLYKKWFFWTISPALNFPRENTFHRTPSLTVRFDVILGSI